MISFERNEGSASAESNNFSDKGKVERTVRTDARRVCRSLSRRLARHSRAVQAALDVTRRRAARAAALSVTGTTIAEALVAEQRRPAARAGNARAV